MYRRCVKRAEGGIGEGKSSALEGELEVFLSRLRKASVGSMLKQMRSFGKEHL